MVKVRINERGYLEAERRYGGEPRLVNAVCPFRKDGWCGDECPMFGDVTEGLDKEMDHPVFYLHLHCQSSGLAEFEVVEDAR